ncbi:hypothetical protein RJ527_16385 [Thalassospiraceae bacterium LMO-SO8]|nr:hypothetical protein [Alphaproteobacteria bacterium LMO-S08]WND75601.1 hypothetical protein RJ527_16385 [Thalassospiraceae bacterium LMO-SO8]
MAILLVGIAMVMPPFAQVVLVDANLFGLPIPLLYIFTVWAALILGAAVMARPLSNAGRLATPPRQGGGEPIPPTDTDPAN